MRRCLPGAILLCIACTQGVGEHSTPLTDSAAAPNISVAVPEDSTSRDSPAEVHVEQARSLATDFAPETDLEPGSARRITKATWVERWRRGGSRADSVMRKASFIATDGLMAYVLDRDPHAVVAFRVSDGVVAWRSDTMDLELAFLRAVAVAPNGHVIVLDDRKVLHRISPRGEWLTSTPLGDASTPHTLCVPDDSSFVLFTLAEGTEPILRFDTTGRVLEKYRFPWTDLQSATAIERQSMLATGHSGQCVVALAFGRGFATMRGGSVGVRQSYVEAVALPNVNVTSWDVGGQQARQVQLAPGQRSAVLSIAVRDSTLLVLFAGHTNDRYRLVDSYDLATGTYLESWRLPIQGRALAVAGDVLLVLGIADGLPTLVALTAP